MSCDWLLTPISDLISSHLCALHVATVWPSIIAMLSMKFAFHGYSYWVTISWGHEFTFHWINLVHESLYP